ncbi:protein kinase domain containing protein [Entamoeba histolytica]|uniref:Protein kinase domain containing protein n=2 Tax=Entamoeba histolytica TaxID=5759 RepID=B1N574_ENTH1|nr:protein kinase domain containing protein [Entamoeba histolytica HM-1:IMSS]EDS88884.1 protein kinase domain containing protein [Entamoeba histolytica HM-1:IMSS]GAT99277.1 protein kinase domain containing protein [Entamoeba histolytica]|eukprot:XP_001914340.1 protein kinase domain containing protein [Entamoeba histolytica HM-1:IMSS]
MLIFYIILLSICIHAKAYDCIPSGDKFEDGFNDNFLTLCKTTNNDYSYHFKRDFTYSLKETMECENTYFNGTFTMTSLKDYWNAKTFKIQKSSQITLNGKFHTREEFNIGKNSKINWNGNVSFERLIKFETTPSLNQPQLIIWNSNWIHLYKPTTTSTGQFKIQNPSNNDQCFDVMSFNNNTALDFDKKSDNHYLPKDFDNGLSMTDGTAYLLSNKRLMRFCPNGIKLNKTVICTLNDKIYSLSSYSGRGDYIFNYPHCPCDDNRNECTLNIQSSLTTVNFNMANISNTILHIDHNILLNKFVYAKQINVDDNVKLLINSLSSNNEYKQMLKFNNFEITNIRKQNNKPQFKYNSETNTLEIDGNNHIKHLSNPSKTPFNLIINGNLTCNSFVSDCIYYFTTSSISTTLTINGNGNNNIMIIDENITLNDPFPNCIILTGKSNEEFKCIKCKNGYYLNSNNECQENSHCIKLNNQNHCVECEYGYYLNSMYECKRNLNGCKIGTETHCYQCKEGYVKENGECKRMNNCKNSERNYCLKCLNGYKIENNTCVKDKEECYYEGNECVSCSNEYTLNNGTCESKENKNGKNQEIYCENGKYIKDNQCIECPESAICNSDGIELKCKDNQQLDNNKCINETCEEGKIKDQNGKCNSNISNCSNELYVNGKCVECLTTYSPDSKGECINTTIENCEEQNTYGCKRCSDGYYLTTNMKCSKCDDNCTTCFSSATYCMSCSSDKYLSSNRTCQSNKELNGTCLQLLADGSGCGICNKGYYRNGKGCEICERICETCNQKDKCITCADEYFMSWIGECKSIDEVKGCKGEIDKEYGCRECSEGYYLINKECSKCKENCTRCSTKNECNSCENEYVLTNKECIYYLDINKCKEVKNNKCWKCSFWYGTNEEGNECNKEVVWWMIMIIVIIIVIIIIITIVMIIMMVNYIMKRREKKEREKTTTIFKITQSNIKFIPLGDGILTNKKEIELQEGEEIKVNEEIRELICIGNDKKEKMKIQISSKEENEKYSIRTNPNVITIEGGYACEFELFITIKCTAKIKDKIMIISKTLNKAQEETIKSISIEGETEISTRLDPDEIKEEKKIGEGSFGIVYVGEFRGNKVAIKKMKQVEESEDKKKEFEKEVAMLDKFRDEYIIQFYGAVFIPNKICMVTEFAKYGSIQDIMNKRNITEISKKIRIKFMIDGAKGISYLHSNGILHRDIKPDNFLVVSLDDNIEVNCKLTDFGSARNINMMMTNMTFTKGIGSPIYMAPEVLNHQHYKMPSDIYSFSITMLQIITWQDPFPKSEFKFPWKIAEFISTGKRPVIIQEVEEDIKEIIEKSWQQEPKERITIDEIVRMLERIENKE